MKFQTMRLVYRNMIWKRPKLGLYGLIVLALFTTANMYFSLLRIGSDRITTGVMVGFALLCWFVILPMIFTMIDCYKSPKRIDNLLIEMRKK
jgi:hypothetical protein